MKLWGGRFEGETDKLVDEFNASINIDSKMYKQDIEGSIAHVKMLGECGIIPAEDSLTIEKGLTEILSEIEDGKVEFSEEAEDIHMNIETLLINKIGEVGKRLHTSRSRNDQVALDFRMYTKQQIIDIIALLAELEQALLNSAEKYIDVIMPGYTHMQKAQPITFGHHVMAYFEMIKRDIDRFRDCLKRTDVMPLGSCALAGTTYPINRQRVADLLGFASITQNSLDAVSDRDFALEFMNCCSIFMMHMSRFCEEIIIWNTGEFSFVEMDDAYSTGSSIMPQKKNPDVAELIRGKTGRVYGGLFTLLTIMKSLPLAYNKDMQEDKEALFDGAETVKQCIQVFIPMFEKMKINSKSMKEKLDSGFLNATDIADYLVKKGIPFRTTHEISGKLVKYCTEKNCTLGQVTLEEYKTFSDLFENDIYEAIDMVQCVNKRNTVGGPSHQSVMYAIENGKAFLQQL